MFQFSRGVRDEAILQESSLERFIWETALTLRDDELFQRRLEGSRRLILVTGACQLEHLLLLQGPGIVYDGDVVGG